MRHFGKKAALCVCLVVLGWGVGLAAELQPFDPSPHHPAPMAMPDVPAQASEPQTSCQADHWPAYPMPSSDKELDAYFAHVKLRPTYIACLKKGGDADDAAVCVRDEYRHQQPRLERAYQQLQARVGTQRQAQLADEQDRWLRWRDTRCARGEIEIGIAACLVEMDADRATQLEERMAGLVQDRRSVR